MAPDARTEASPRTRARWGVRCASAWLIVLASLAAIAPWLALDDPARIDLSSRNAAPGPAHWLGTDALGRDLLARVLHGARVSLLVGLAAPAIGLALGGAIGLLAGFRRGWLDRIVGVLVDALLAFPALILALIVGVYVGRGVGSMIATLAVLSVPACARVARSAALAVSQLEYVEAARAGGSSELRILWRHVIPNALPRLATFALLLIAVMIVVEGALGFLGLGVAPPAPSWGGMIAEGRAQLEDAPHVCLAPAAALFATVLALNVLGESLYGRGGALAGVRRGRP
jgi:peptide/nickel transport system permease protein